MDINCTHSCMYQTEGKCNLRELPSTRQTTYSRSGTDCPYYAQYTPFPGA
ncbi:MAG: hydroxymyristoyl-ACP dehydratase [Clostridiales bacterium]|jgi:hypothetical protein|nr:hydroxymyristoyl-ACP dehydratase [Clostridiales bacterium]